MEMCGVVSCSVGYEFCFDSRCRKCDDFDEACNSTLQSKCYAHCDDISNRKFAAEIASIIDVFREKVQEIQGELSENEIWSYALYAIISVLAIGLITMIAAYVKNKMSNKDNDGKRKDTVMNSHDNDNNAGTEEEKQLLENTNALVVEVDETKNPEATMPPNGKDEQEEMVGAVDRLKQIKPRDNPNDCHYEKAKHQFLPSGRE